MNTQPICRWVYGNYRNIYRCAQELTESFCIQNVIVYEIAADELSLECVLLVQACALSKYQLAYSKAVGSLIWVGGD